MLQANLELFFEVRQQEDRENQENQELPHELSDDDEQGHNRMPPMAVIAVSSGGQRFRSPLQAFQKRARRAFPPASE